MEKTKPDKYKNSLFQHKRQISNKKATKTLIKQSKKFLRNSDTIKYRSLNLCILQVNTGSIIRYENFIVKVAVIKCT